MSRWWSVERGDTDRLEAFSDGVLAIAITLLILDVKVEVPAGTSLATALGHALPQIGAHAMGFVSFVPLPPGWSPRTPPARTPGPRCCSTAARSAAARSRST